MFLYAAMFPSRWRQIAFLGAVWGVVTASLHLILGPADHVLGLIGTLQYNVQFLGDAIFANLPLIPILILGVGAYRAASGLHKRFAWIALGYLAAIVVGGAWNESQRLILPIIPILLPPIMAKVYYNLRENRV